MVLLFRPLKVFLPLAALMIAAGMASSTWNLYRWGSLRETDIIVMVAGFMTCMLGLLAEVVVAQHRRP